MKLITFAVPCYNSQDYMERAVESLLKGGQDVEIIIVDDGSMDATKEIADDYAEKYPDIIKVIHQENGGHGEAVNTGLRHATGLYYKVVDSDDWVDEESLKKVIETLREMVENTIALDMLVVNYVYEKLHLKKRKIIDYNGALPKGKVFGWQDVGHFKNSQNILMHSVFFRTKLLRDIGLELPKHTFYVDNIFVFDPLPYVKNIYYLDVNFYRYFIGREDQSVNEAVMISRIDQQIAVTKRMINDYTKAKVRNKKLKNYMVKYLMIMLSICTSLLMIDGSPESLEKNRELWDYLKKKDRRLHKAVSSFILGRCIQMTNKPGRKIITMGYHLSRKIYGFN